MVQIVGVQIGDSILLGWTPSRSVQTDQKALADDSAKIKKNPDILNIATKSELKCGTGISYKYILNFCYQHRDIFLFNSQ
jgi:hypothetical protein